MSSQFELPESSFFTDRFPGPVPRVSVVLPCRNEAPHIVRTLTSILAQQEPEGGLEILVADGRSDDGTREILGRLAAENPKIRVVDNPNQITACGLNAAIRAARGQIIVRMDGHTDYAPDYVVQCVKALESTGAENVGGPWVATGYGYWGEAIAASFQSPFAAGGGRAHAPDYEGEVDTVYLGCWRKETFQKLGGFDEELVRNQDDEHNLRIRRAGGRVWQSPKIRSWYHSRITLRDLFHQYRGYGYWKVRVIRKHGGPASSRHLVPGAFLVLLLSLTLIGVVCAHVSALWPPTTGPGSFSATLLKPVLVMLLGLVLLYLSASLVAAACAAARSRWRFLPVLPAIFCCYHFGYGWGFLRGILDFWILNRRAGAPLAVLPPDSPFTQPSAKG